jgi:hypothetical protein
MAIERNGLQRRQLLALAAYGLVMNAAGQNHGATGNGRGNAQDTPNNTGQLNPKSANAIALGYVSDHRQVDRARWQKKGLEGGEQQRCASCAMFSPGNGATGRCSIFGQQLVASEGWCNAWTGG